jgi:hypothetical protein
MFWLIDVHPQKLLPRPLHLRPLRISNVKRFTLDLAYPSRTDGVLVVSTLQKWVNAGTLFEE